MGPFSRACGAASLKKSAFYWMPVGQVSFFKNLCWFSDSCHDVGDSATCCWGVCCKCCSLDCTVDLGVFPCHGQDYESLRIGLTRKLTPLA